MGGWEGEGSLQQLKFTVYELYKTTFTDFKRVSVNLTSFKWHMGEGVKEMPTCI